MPAKTKAPDKRKYERDEPVSLRPLDTLAALKALLRVKPPASEKPPAESLSRRSQKSRPAAKPGKD